MKSASASVLAVAVTLAITTMLPVHAETLVVDDQLTLRESSVQRPPRGASMQTVEARFGAPAEKHATVGNPPITRWDYPGFAVFFEGSLVIHAVATAP